MSASDGQDAKGQTKCKMPAPGFSMEIPHREPCDAVRVGVNDPEKKPCTEKDTPMVRWVRHAHVTHSAQQKERSLCDSYPGSH